MAARVTKTLAFPIPGIAAGVRERNARPVSLQLVRGQVHRIDRADGVREIHVLDGMLWLTVTPADGDILLRSTQRFVPTTGWPLVFEALEDAAVLLVR
jgi:hypothetical protein